MQKLAPLFPYYRPYRRQLATGIACVFASALINLLAPIAIGLAIDSLSAGISYRGLLIYAGAVVGASLVQGIFRYFQRMILVAMSRCIELDLMNDFFAHLARLHPGFYQRKSTGDLMARATNDVQAVRMLAGPAVMYAANTLFSTLAIVLFMLSIHAGLTLVAISTLPLVAVAAQFLGQRIYVLFEEVQERFSSLTTQVQENLAGNRVVRAYAREEVEERKFAAVNREYVERNKRLIRWHAASQPLLHLVVGLGLAAVLLYGGHLLIGGHITLGQFVTFNIFFGEMLWPMVAIGWVINLFQRGTASLRRIRTILDTEPAIRDRAPLTRIDRIAGALTFRRLSFSYDGGRPAPEQPVLAAVDLEIAAGETVAVVGRTGAGKSTLLSLVPRLCDPPPGGLAVDGVEIRRLPLADLRAAIAMVPQETFLFSTTIRENIAFGRPGASDEEVARAAELAGLESDLADFPQGLETRVGERGLTLSGGQKQRVALARALVRDPRILLLDDCLSAVDAHTEERILSNLRTVFEGRTVLFVTHRVSAARMADQVVVLERGRIVERGSHRDLLAHGGVYADLHRRQLLEEELAAAV